MNRLWVCTNNKQSNKKELVEVFGDWEVNFIAQRTKPIGWFSYEKRLIESDFCNKKFCKIFSSLFPEFFVFKFQLKPSFWDINIESSGVSQFIKTLSIMNSFEKRVGVLSTKGIT